MFALLPYFGLAASVIPVGAIVGMCVFFLGVMSVVFIYLICQSRAQKREQEQRVANESRIPITTVESIYPPNPTAHYVPIEQQIAELNQRQLQKNLMKLQGQYPNTPAPIGGPVYVVQAVDPAAVIIPPAGDVPEADPIVPTDSESSEST